MGLLDWGLAIIMLVMIGMTFYYSMRLPEQKTNFRWAAAYSVVTGMMLWYRVS